MGARTYTQNFIMAIHVRSQMELKRKLLHVANGVLKTSQPCIRRFTYFRVVPTNEWLQEWERWVHVALAPLAHMVFRMPTV